MRVKPLQGPTVSHSHHVNQAGTNAKHMEKPGWLRPSPPTHRTPDFFLPMNKTAIHNMSTRPGRTRNARHNPCGFVPAHQPTEILSNQEKPTRLKRTCNARHNPCELRINPHPPQTQQNNRSPVGEEDTP